MFNLGALFSGGGNAIANALGAAGKQKGIGSALEQLGGAKGQQDAVGTWDALASQIPNLKDYDLGQLADFPELQQLAAAEKLKSAYEEGGGEGFDARLRALNKLEGVADSGETAQGALDRARMIGDSGMRDKAARDAILAREQEMSGGNNTGRRLADQLLNSQAGADRRAMGDLGVQANLEGSRLSALQGIGSMGSGLTADQQRQQEARDRIAQFNTQNQNSRDFANNATANQTLLGKDDRARENLNLRNQQQEMNNQLAQQKFQNQFGIAQGKAGQQASAGQNMQQNAQYNAGLTSQNNQFGQQMQAQYAQMGMKGLGAAAQAMAGSDKRTKTGIEKAELDIEDFLNSLTGYRYKYKDPFSEFATPGTKVGIMAQDIENTLPGQSIVKETDKGKVIDTKEAVNPILASLGNINERLKKVGI